jgi:hypothetical protein
VIKTTILLLIFAAAAMASTQFNAILASPNNSAAPGWYDGSGNPNGGFTVDTENGIEIGLRIKLRQDPNVISSPDDIYDVPIGPQPSSPTHAIWNYEFSIDLEPLGVGSLTLADITASLVITDVTTSVTSASINPLTYWNDDSGFGSTGKTTPESTTQWGVQQSENPIFADFPLAADYNENAVRLYQFTLTVTQNSNGALLGSDTVFAQTVAPEPSTFLFIGVGLALLILSTRTKLGNTPGKMAGTINRG